MCLSPKHGSQGKDERGYCFTINNMDCPRRRQLLSFMHIGVSTAAHICEHTLGPHTHANLTYFKYNQT